MDNTTNRVTTQPKLTLCLKRPAHFPVVLGLTGLTTRPVYLSVTGIIVGQTVWGGGGTVTQNA